MPDIKTGIPATQAPGAKPPATPKTGETPNSAVSPTIPAPTEQPAPQVIPDLVLTARPVVTTLGKINAHGTGTPSGGVYGSIRPYAVSYLKKQRNMREK